MKVLASSAGGGSNGFITVPSLAAHDAAAYRVTPIKSDDDGSRFRVLWNSPFPSSSLLDLDADESTLSPRLTDFGIEINEGGFRLDGTKLSSEARDVSIHSEALSSHTSVMLSRQQSPEQSCIRVIPPLAKWMSSVVESNLTSDAPANRLSC